MRWLLAGPFDVVKKAIIMDFQLVQVQAGLDKIKGIIAEDAQEYNPEVLQEVVTYLDIPPEMVGYVLGTRCGPQAEGGIAPAWLRTAQHAHHPSRNSYTRTLLPRATRPAAQASP